MSRTLKPATSPKSEALPEGVELSKAPVERLAYRLDDLAEALGVSRRTIERERSAGRFPQPDLKIGKAPLWTPATIQRWIEGGGQNDPS